MGDIPQWVNAVFYQILMLAGSTVGGLSSWSCTASTKTEDHLLTGSDDEGA